MGHAPGHGPDENLVDRTGLKLDVSVNLSAADFNSGALVGNLQALLIEFALDPARIELEVTESVWLRGKSGVVEQLDALRALGFSIAIDDFGSGYSNFSYLNELPVTTIKIDRSLIVDIEHSDRRARLVRMLVMLANELGYRTVAKNPNYLGMSPLEALSLDIENLRDIYRSESLYTTEMANKITTFEILIKKQYPDIFKF